MEEQISDLKKTFTKLIDVRAEVHTTFIGLNNIVTKLNTIYTEFIKKSQDNVLIFGLDSLRFQSKLIGIEYEDMKRLFYAINNRMYCEYYKLYKIIMEYIVENVSDVKIVDMVKSDVYVFPVYKDLEPFKQYDFTLIQNLHEIIIALLQAINGYISNKDNELEAYKIKNSSGLNIDNFVTTFNFNIVVMREKLTLFVTYVEFFHKLHNKYLKRLTTKIQLMFSQIANDIQFEDTSQTKKEKRKSLLNNMVDDNIDKHLLHELKHSIISNEIDSPVSPKSVDTTTAICTNTDENIIFNIFPKIEDNIVEEISTEEPITEPITEPILEPIVEPIVEPIIEPIIEPIKLVIEEVVIEIIEKLEENVTKEDDDMSALTIESSTNNTTEMVDQQEVIEPVKKKRAYKSRNKA